MSLDKSPVNMQRKKVAFKLDENADSTHKNAIDLKGELSDKNINSSSDDDDCKLKTHEKDRKRKIRKVKTDKIKSSNIK